MGGRNVLWMVIAALAAGAPAAAAAAAAAAGAEAGGPALVGQDPGATPTPTPTPTASPEPTPTPPPTYQDGQCRDTLAPASDFTGYRIAPGGITLRGVSIDAGGCGQRVTKVSVALTYQGGTGKCRPVRLDGSLGPRDSCRGKAYITASGTRKWMLRITELPPRGRYLAHVRAIDESGNFEASSRDNRLRLRVR